ncbi:MAG: hypothetical protein MJZ74_02750 [Muribaculaceae bacterium]|nr:hypothetical protein [Muribaculaceae bacterium]
MRTIVMIMMALLAMTQVNAAARTRTTHNHLSTDAVAMDRVVPEAGDTSMTVRQDAVTLRGYNKRASDSKESFFITNNLNHRISSVRLLMRYTMLNGTILHERTVTVPVTLKPGETQLVSVKTFDIQRLFYYYGGPKPRKSATPFKVAVRLQGYDIPVGY